MILEVEHLKVQFPTRRGTLTAVDDASFSIAPGEILGVVGESGAGKSLTGLSIIGLLEPPGRIAGGEIRLEGERIDRLPPEAMRRVRGRRIGMVFQDPLTSLNPRYTIGAQLEETIATHLALTPAECRRRALDLLGEVGIPAAAERYHHYPHQFSGGMRQRVVIALAIAAEPALIIADEPTTALDVSIQAQIIALLKRLCREHGTAVMLITHDMGVIAETAQRVAVMYAGRIVEIGPVAELIHRPSHPHTLGLMGSIPSIAADRDHLAHIDRVLPRLAAVARPTAGAKAARRAESGRRGKPCDRRWRDVGPRRRIGLRQVDGRAAYRRPLHTDARPHPVRRRGPRRRRCRPRAAARGA